MINDVSDPRRKFESVAYAARKCFTYLLNSTARGRKPTDTYLHVWPTFPLWRLTTAKVYYSAPNPFLIHRPNGTSRFCENFTRVQSCCFIRFIRNNSPVPDAEITFWLLIFARQNGGAKFVDTNLSATYIGEKKNDFYFTKHPRQTECSDWIARLSLLTLLQ